MNATPNGVDVADVCSRPTTAMTSTSSRPCANWRTRAAGSQDAEIKALRARVAQHEDELRGLHQEGGAE